ncbi:hypothetical protein E2C01_036432 [Portunus trituberculatus]|uniref:Uncharacterized protein n=1 Tax=Portunus trituberculatus TaxID=210409 RepID=A0A5B7F6P9_PORTR|nr:hypothetical protein [Portunus trituberculatus]
MFPPATLPRHTCGGSGFLRASASSPLILGIPQAIDNESIIGNLTMETPVPTSRPWRAWPAEWEQALSPSVALYSHGEGKVGRRQAPSRDHVAPKWMGHLKYRGGHL